MKDYLAKGVDTLLTSRAQLTQTLRDRYIEKREQLCNTGEDAGIRKNSTKI